MSDCEIDGENIVRKIAGMFTFMWLIAAALMPAKRSEAALSRAIAEGLGESEAVLSVCLHPVLLLALSTDDAAGDEGVHERGGGIRRVFGPGGIAAVANNVA